MKMKYIVGYRRIDNPSMACRIQEVVCSCKDTGHMVSMGGTTFVQELVSCGELSWLEHGYAAYQVTEKVYKAVKKTIQYWEGQRNAPRFADIGKSALHLTQTKQGETKRYLISGSYRAWYDWVHYLHTDYLAQKDISGMLENMLLELNHDLGGLLHKFLEYINHPYTFQAVTEKERLITPVQTGTKLDMSMLTDTERKIHEQVTVLVTCDIGTTWELSAIDGLSVGWGTPKQDSSFELTAMNTGNILGLNAQEIEMVYAQAYKNAEDAYKKLTALGVSKQDAERVLPQAAETVICVTANLLDWNRTFCHCNPRLWAAIEPLCNDIAKDYPFAIEV